MQHNTSVRVCSWDYSRTQSPVGWSSLLTSSPGHDKPDLSVTFLTELDMTSITLNSIDAISERDFVGKHNSVILPSPMLEADTGHGHLPSLHHLTRDLKSHTGKYQTENLCTCLSSSQGSLVCQTQTPFSPPAFLPFLQWNYSLLPPC